MLAGLMVLSTSAFAATNNPDFINAQKGQVDVVSQSKDVIAKGFKVSLGASSLELNIDLPTGNSVTEDLDTSSQITFGYSNIRANKIGFNADLSYLSGEMAGQDSDFKIIEDNLRISANATYGINDKIYAFGGLNSSSYTSKTFSFGTSTLEIDHTPGIGYQLGMGYQITKNIGIELAYLTMNSKMTLSGGDIYDEQDNLIGDSVDYDIETKGTQINLIGTF
jgi:long-subunit fatty acid transport protein